MNSISEKNNRKNQNSSSYRRFVLYFCIFFLSQTLCFTQDSRLSHLYIHLDTEIVVDSFQLEKTEVRNKINAFIHEKIMDGYVLAALDSIVEIEKDYHAYIYMGRKYRFVKNNKNYSVAKTLDTLQNLNETLKEKGYPFSQVYLDSFIVQDSLFSAVIKMDSNAYTPLSNIILDGNNRLGDRYFLNVTGLKLNEPFNLSQFEEAKNALKSLPYVNLIESDLAFGSDGATATFYMDKISNSTFDFLVGLAPKENESGYDVIGNVNLNLVNQFGNGEVLNLRYDKLQNNRQNLNTAILFPYIGNFPFGVDGAFELNKPDTSQTEIYYSLGLRYNISNRLNMTLSYIQRKFLLSNLDLDFIRQNGHLPNQLDFNTTQIGLKVFYQKLDYIFNPRSGVQILTNILTGTKRIIENADIYNLNWELDSIAKLYQNIPNSTPSLEINLDVQYFIPVFKRSTILMGLNGGIRSSGSTNLLSNENYRLGGYSSLRGFNEEALLASQYAKALLEYRLLIEKNSNFYVFSEWSNLNNQEIYFNTISAGVGLNFETKIGIFGITFANGNEVGRGLDLKNTKVHFGMQSRF